MSEITGRATESFGRGRRLQHGARGAAYPVFALRRLPAGYPRRRLRGHRRRQRLDAAVRSAGPGGSRGQFPTDPHRSGSVFAGLRHQSRDCRRQRGGDRRNDRRRAHRLARNYRLRRDGGPPVGQVHCADLGLPPGPEGPDEERAGRLRSAPGGSRCSPPRAGWRTATACSTFRYLRARRRGAGSGPSTKATPFLCARPLWDELEGYDERFTSPGGGLVNLDLLFRAVALPDVSPVTLLGEGTFHQVHGGIATSGMEAPHTAWQAEYLTIRGRPIQRASYRSNYLGCVSPNSLKSVAISAGAAMPGDEGNRQ